MLTNLKKKKLTNIIVFIIGFAILGKLSNYSYLLFHVTVEFIAAMIGYIMVIIIVNTRSFSKNNMFTFLGISFAFIGSIDLIHAIVYKGMNLTNITSANTATQLWIIARYVESISVFIAVKDNNRQFNIIKTLVVYFIIFIYSILVTFNSSLFPVCYVDGLGMTKFKIISEYIVASSFVVITYLLYRNKNKNKSIHIKDEYAYLVSSAIFTILSEIAFTFNFSIYGFVNFLGHIFKCMSVYYIYISLIRKKLKEPYNNIFNDLNESLEQLKVLNNNLSSKNSELERRKNRLEKSLKIYRDFIEVVPLGIIIRQNDMIVYTNNKVAKLLKYDSKKDIIGKNLFELLEDESKEIVKERIVMESKEKMSPPLNERFICADGTTIDLEVCVTSITIDEKEYFMGVLREITDLKRMKAMEIELEKKTQYELIRNEFLANVSHELRTPINVIYSALQLDDIYFKREDYDGIKKSSKVIKQNCLRLLRLINNLIDIIRIDSGFFKPVIKCINIVEVVENIVLSVVEYVESRGMNIVFDTEVEEVYVNCDPDLIERVMLNLISNSIKYGKENGCIYVSIFNDLDKFVSISVKDDGIGISKYNQAIIFERFIRADKSLTRNCEGSGIGLSLVKSLVEIQNGTIKLHSEENIGTEIAIKFPLTKLQEESCAASEKDIESRNIIKKIDVEFSDIYEL